MSKREELEAIKALRIRIEDLERTAKDLEAKIASKEEDSMNTMCALMVAIEACSIVENQDNFEHEWIRAAKRLAEILHQKGCGEFNPSLNDDKLTTFIDVCIDG